MSLSLSFGFEKGTLFSSSANRFEPSFSECSSPPETPRSEVFDFSDDESVASTCSSLQLSPARWRPSLRRKYGLGLSQGSPPRDRRSQQRQWKDDEMASSPPSLSDRCVMLLDAPWCEKRPHPRASPRSSQNSSPPAHPSTSTESCGRTRTVHAQSAPVESAHNEMVMRRLQCMRQTQDLVGELRSIREAGQRLRDRQLELRRLKRQKVGELQLMELEMASAWYGRDWLGLEIPAQAASLETAPSHTTEGANVHPLLKQHGGQLIPRPGAVDMLRGLDLGSLIGMGEEELEDMEFDLRKDEKEKRLKLELARVTDALNTGKLEGRRLVAVASQKRAMLRHIREELASVQALLRTERNSRCNSEPADPPTPSSAHPTASITSTTATTLAQSKPSSPIPHSPITDSPLATSPTSSNSPTSNSVVEPSIPPSSPQVIVPSRFSDAKSEGTSPPNARQRRESRRGRSAGDIPYAETPSPEKRREDAAAAERSGVRTWVSKAAAALSSSSDQVSIGVPVPGDSAATQRGRRRFSEGDIDIRGVWETGDRRVVEVVQRWRTRANGWAVDVVDGKPAWVHSVPGKSPSSLSPRKLQTSPQKASGFGQVGEALQRTEAPRKGPPAVNRRLNYGHGGGGGGPEAESSNKEEEVEKGRSRRKGVAELERREAWVARPKSDASEEERGEGWTIEFVRGRPKWVRATKPLPQPGESPRRGGFVEVRVILGVKDEENENDGSLSGAKLGSNSEMQKDLSQTEEEDDGAGVTLHLEVNSRERDDAKVGSANLVGELGERIVHGEEGMSVEEVLPKKAEEVAMKKGLQGTAQIAKEGTATKGLAGVVAPARVGPVVANDGRTTDRMRRTMSAPPDSPRGRLDGGGRPGSTDGLNTKGVNSHHTLVRKGDSLGDFSGRFGRGRTGPEKGRRTLKVAAVNMLRDIVGWPMLTRGGLRALAGPGKSRLESANMREDLEVVTPPRGDLAGMAVSKVAEVESSRIPKSVGPHGTPVMAEETGNDRGTECKVMQAKTTASPNEPREVPSGEEGTSALSTSSMGYERSASSGWDAEKGPAAVGILETFGGGRTADESTEQQTSMVMGVTGSGVEMSGRVVGGEEGMVAVVPSVGACDKLAELSVAAHSSSSSVLSTGEATRREEVVSSEGHESGVGAPLYNAEGSDGLGCQPLLEDVEGRTEAGAQRGGKEAETGFFVSGDVRECEIQPCELAEGCCSKAVEIEISEITSSTLLPGGSRDVAEGVSGMAGEDVGYLQPCDDDKSGDLSDGGRWGLSSMFCKVNRPVIPGGLTVAAEDSGEVVDQEVVIGTVEESVEVVTKNVVMFHTSESSRDGGSDKYTEDDFPEVAAATVNRFLWSFGEEEAGFDEGMSSPVSEGDTIFDEGMEKPVAGDLMSSFCQEKESGWAGAAFDEHVGMPKAGDCVFSDDNIFPGKMLKATKGSLTGSGESNDKQELLEAAEELVFEMERLSGCESSEKVEPDNIGIVDEQGLEGVGETAELDGTLEVDSAKEHMSDCEEVRTPRSGGLAELFGAALGLYWPLGQQNGKSSPRESLSPRSGSANATDSEGEKGGLTSSQSTAGTRPTRNGILKAREEETSHGGSAKGTPRTSPLSRISTGANVDEESSNAKRAASESQRWLLELYSSGEQAAEGVVSPPMLQL